MINYYDVFRQRAGQINTLNPWTEGQIDTYLDQAAVKQSRSFATPWDSFISVTESYKWPIVIMAAIEYWWAQAASYVDKSDIKAGSGGIGKISTTLFDKALRMITFLQEELEEYADTLPVEGSGDVFVGTLVKRSKMTGYLVPRADDPHGDWY